MQRHLLRHWRGEESLLVATLVNGVVGYVAAVAAVLVLGQALPGGLGAVIGIAGFVAWAIWAGVGIVRGAFRHYVAPGQPLWRRLVGLATVALVASAGALMLRDLTRLFL